MQSFAHELWRRTWDLANEGVYRARATDRAPPDEPTEELYACGDPVVEHLAELSFHALLALDTLTERGADPVRGARASAVSDGSDDGASPRSLPRPADGEGDAT